MEDIIVEMGQVVGTNQAKDTTLLAEQKTNMLIDNVIRLQQTDLSVIKVWEVMQNVTRQTNNYN
ncbi:hypothetical protein H70357_13350 [Paenibacillus sp. FSL H7-0357]|uniref:hypothetical protein n=1 Tax=Paenibacillus sp. FSL H7-0357 TaxID=1536774 RepID=UPI0004F58895|nr:hypothetical protein [Paenibacillus sp. FSL H7-0357]AIQ17537.1 hypothetical protein H70357_13350 [Paenibacillus sp. FSL H7-0357]